MATIDTNMSLVMIDPSEPLELYDGTIIKGRLEWFLYALCCLDYGNLPTPLSRIEEWANALITNELPNMEPQSRAEEFFKAILTGDTSNLPTPQSRSEVLLDKLARGENDFTNVEKIQSRYEFLLAYLIKNGGGIGNIDYVLYKFQKEDETLYNTKERPVKSAILTGQTLVNVDSYYVEGDFVDLGGTLSDDGWITLNANGSYVNEFTRLNSLVKPNTKYLAIVEVKENTLNGYFTLFSQHNNTAIFSGQTVKIASGRVGTFKYVLTSDATFTPDTNICLRNYVGTAETSGSITYQTMLIEYQQGMENWDIPFFRGMQSVKMPVLTTTGFNMVNPTDIEVIGCNSYDVDSDGIANIVGDTTGYWARSYIRYTHHLKANTTYYIYCDGDSTGTIKTEGWVDNNNSGRISWNNFYKYTPETDVLYEAKIFLNTDASPFTCSKIRIGIFESTTKPSSFEPFKSNILSTSEDVELRGIGDVKDTLDLTTGEVVQNIYEFTLDGSQNIDNDGDLLYYNLPLGVHNNRSNSDKLPSITIGQILDGLIGIAPQNRGKSSRFYIKVNGITTREEMKNFFLNNPTTIQCILETPIIKTVDLSIVDQGGATIPKLKTFDKITHVNVSATDVLPGVEMEVATTIGEDLSGTLYSTMEDIETKQEALKEPNNAQTESVNSTMMATTEIYESLL